MRMAKCTRAASIGRTAEPTQSTAFWTCVRLRRRAGGQGDRYTIRMNNHETHIFFEHNLDFGSPIPGRWFMERREESQ